MIKVPFCLTAWLVSFLTLSLHAQVSISEFMAAKNQVLADEDGAYPDWIEIHNGSSIPANLNGWYLTDDAADLTKWRFPATNLAAGANLIVFASGKNRAVSGSPLHANFNLSSQGEFLALVQPDGVTISSQFAPQFPEQLDNYSYGSFQGTNYYFASPSPGTNNTAGFLAFIKDTHFNPDRGFFDTPFNLTISTATTNATIRYTTNGAPPSATNGLVYSGSIPINRTTVIRVAAFRAGFVPSDVDTHTYLFLDDVIRQSTNGAPPAGWPSSWGNNVVDYGMDQRVVNDPAYSGEIKADLKSVPTISIVTELKNLFDPNTGIYANASQDGIEWERPVSLELVRPDGQPGFQADAGLRIRGGFSRDPSDPKHSFRFIFRSEYGDGKLRYELFGPEGDDTIDKFDLRTSQDNSWAYLGDANATFLPDPFSRDTQLALGRPGTRGDFYHVYLNGQYWGIYNTEERPEAEYGASYFGGRPEEYDVIKVEAGPYDVVATDGTIAAWQRLWQAATNGFASDATYQRVQGNNLDGTPNPAYEVLLDVPNLVDYMLVIIYAGNHDGPVYENNFPNNFYALRHQTRRDGFRFVTHDAELSLQGLNDDRTQPITVGDPTAGSTFSESNPQYLWQRLQANGEFRMLVADHVHRHFFNGGALTPAVCAARYAKRTNEINHAVVGESARWGDAKRQPPITRADWVSAVTSLMNNYFPSRSGIVLNQLRSRGLYPTNDAPRFNPLGGVVSTGFNVTMSVTNGTIYYTSDGTDPRLPGGAVASSAAAYAGPVPITESVLIKARARAGTSWSALTEATFYVRQDFSGLFITEIMYRPPDEGVVDGEDFEFIELKNVSNTELDLSGVCFTNGIRFTFPVGSRLAPGQFAVWVSNPTAFQGKYPAVPVRGTFTGHLADSGETLALVDAAGSNIVTLTYGDRDPWPQSADGVGFSLVPVNANFDPAPADPLNWRASSAVGGSPGADDPPLSLPPVVINEVLTHTDPPQLDSIELVNPTTNTANIGGWYLTDSRTNPNKFHIPTGTTIPSGSYLVFDETQFNAVPGSSTNFNLSSHGEEVYLYSADAAGNLTGYSDGFSFGAAQNGVSFGRYVNSVGEIQYPGQSVNSLGAVNNGPGIGPVVINEIRYHPAPGEDEFVELKNINGSPEKLYNPTNGLSTWRLNGVDFRFPPNTEIAPNGLVLLVGTDPAAFRARYAVPAEVPVFGPWNGSLQDGGELVELQKPDHADVDTNGVVFVPYITVDAVRYDNRPPWPTNTAGFGPSLERLNASSYGNDPINWRASPGAASPGLENTGNRRPSVFAGLDRTVAATQFPVTVSLDGNVSDDGQPNPPGSFSTSWSQVGGPAAVVIANTNALKTSASFPGVGTYVLRFAADDGQLQATGDITVTLSIDQSPTTLVTTGSVWKFLDDGSDQGNAWLGASFDDSTWKSGPAQLGYGDNDEATTVGYGPDAGNKYITTYFRRAFNVTNATNLLSLDLRLLRDDGAVVYLNGTEIFRSNMPNGVITHRTLALVTVVSPEESTFFETAVPPGVLVEGSSVLAVEIHQGAVDSSDISFDLELTGVRLPVNQAPTVSAGNDQTIDLTAIAFVNGVVTDDGLPIPPGLLTNGWSRASGPGTVTFQDASRGATVARFSQAGTYSLRLTAGDGQYTSTDTVTVAVTNGIDSWKALHFTSAELSNPAISGDNADPDGDSQSNVQEYIAGTNPRDAQSVLRLEVIAASSATRLRFQAEAGRSYSLLYRSSLSSGAWQKLSDVSAVPASQSIEITDASSSGARYYCVVTPRQP